MAVDEESKARFLERMTVHERFPGISIDKYLKSRQVELAKSIADKRLIYLDLKFWILLRDAATGHRSDLDTSRLLVLLMGLVETGQALCPISDVVYAEVLKQKNPETREATAKLIDRLSLGVCIVTVDTRMGTELAHAIYHFGGVPNLHALGELAWTKVCYAFGPVHFNPELFTSPEAALAAQKATVDMAWSMTLTEMAADRAGVPPPDPDWEGSAAKINAAMQAHSNEVRNFKELIATELHGALSLFDERAADIFNVLLIQRTGERRSLTEEQRKEVKQDIIRSMIACAIGLEGHKYFPTLHIGAMCHSYIRWDKRRAFKGNDQLDIQHAAAALGYCDVFLTEKPLKAMLTAGNMKLDKLYDRAVVSETKEAVEYLESV